MRRYLILIATLGVIGVNAAANIVPINGVNTGQVSANYPTGFTPAGWVFSIWSLIYLGLIAFSIFAIRATPVQSTRVRRVEAAYVVSCVANSIWIFMWHYGYILASLVMMLALLVSLVVIYITLRRTAALSFGERMCTDMPFSLYLGWITTATLANLAAWFYEVKQYPFGLPMDDWAIITVVVATAIYTAVGVRTRDAIYTAVFAWAAAGIVLQTLPTTQAVRLAAAAGCAVAVLVTLTSAVQRRHVPRR